MENGDNDTMSGVINGRPFDARDKPHVKLKKFVATARGYANDHIIEPGQEFMFDGEPGQWCHEVGKPPTPKKRIDPLMNKELNSVKSTDALLALMAENERMAKELASLKERK